MPMEKKRIALVCGGFSKENVISVRSAATIAEHLKPEHFETYRIVIDPDRWYYAAADGRTYDIDKNDFSLHLPAGKVTFDLALIIIHGDPGENGRLHNDRSRGSM